MRHVQVRLEDAEFEEFTKRWKSAGFESQQEAAHQAVCTVQWEREPELRIPPRLRPLLKQCEEVLAGGNVMAIEAVEKTLRMAVELSRMRPRSSTRA